MNPPSGMQSGVINCGAVFPQNGHGFSSFAGITHLTIQLHAADSGAGLVQRLVTNHAVLAIHVTGQGIGRVYAGRNSDFVASDQHQNGDPDDYFFHASTIQAITAATTAQKMAHTQNRAAHGLRITHSLNFFTAPSPLCGHASSSGVL